MKRYGVFTSIGRRHRVGMRWYRNKQAAIDRAKALYQHYPKRGLVVEEYTFTLENDRVVGRRLMGTVFKASATVTE